MVRCPICGSRDVTKLKTGSYRCNACGFVFYPTRDAIVDMRDLLSGEELTEEEIKALGERITETSESLSKKVFGGDVKNIFKTLSSLDEILAQYDENARVFGIFADFKGNIKGTFLITVAENDAENIKKAYNEDDIIKALKDFGIDAAKRFEENFKNYLELERIDVAYDTIPSMMNYLISEMSGNRNVVYLNVKLFIDNAPKGDMIFIPQKESIKYLKSFLNE